MKTQLHFSQNPPWKAAWATDSVLIFDRVLLKSRATAAWIKKFPLRYGVVAGEKLKDLQAFPKHLEFVHRLAGELPNRNLTIFVAGGGSVGDFGGTIAMLYKRGVRLVHIPTTWLAAIDSAHGGKTALNVRGAKNQIGGFYPAHETYLSHTLLSTQGEERAREAIGELLKIGLLKGGKLWSDSRVWAKTPSAHLWAMLPAAIQGKMSIVAKDPLEKSGIRHLLNLGHTMGHVFEASFEMPHGVAVAYGVIFAIVFSRAEGICTEAAYERMIAHPMWGLFLPSPAYLDCLSLSPKKIEPLLLRDKKRTKGTSLRFVFMKDVGRPVIREIPVARILKETLRQKKLLKDLYG